MVALDPSSGICPLDQVGALSKVMIRPLKRMLLPGNEDSVHSEGRVRSLQLLVLVLCLHQGQISLSTGLKKEKKKKTNQCISFLHYMDYFLIIS